MYTYVLRISPTQFVVWYRSAEFDSGVIHVELHDVSSLQPMSESELSLPRKERSPFAISTDPIAKFTIPQNQPIGLQQVQLLPEFVDCPELFVLVSSGNNWDHMRLHLWSIRPSKQELDVVPQNWFTDGAYDFGYQWITRMARSPETGHLIGDGIRIGSFELSNDGSKFLQWLNARHFPNQVLA
jgi:hypothetical protein